VRGLAVAAACAGAVATRTASVMPAFRSPQLRQKTQVLARVVPGGWSLVMMQIEVAIAGVRWWRIELGVGREKMHGVGTEVDRTA
jgi:hypothetical protein